MTDKKKQRGFLEQACMQTASGGSAGKPIFAVTHSSTFHYFEFIIKGFIEVCIMHPLDLIKTRLQLQIKSANISAQTGNNVSKMFYHKPLMSYRINFRFITMEFSIARGKWFDPKVFSLFTKEFYRRFLSKHRKEPSSS